MAMEETLHCPYHVSVVKMKNRSWKVTVKSLRLVNSQELLENTVVFESIVITICTSFVVDNFFFTTRSHQVRLRVLLPTSIPLSATSITWNYEALTF